MDPETLVMGEMFGNDLATKREKAAPTRSVLTDMGIKKLAVPAIGQKTYLDVIVEPLGVRVSAGGVKTFIVQGRVKGEKHPDGRCALRRRT